ncbi:CubicO group peptidase (beta-lactamase class C family) [Nocardioides massiliensis]|uniref:CubicO group peptidase (Beta-lactamase class C family) n=2 Tax=Nocardioides massiliensis TaxID=1325935 RepID=A0ABT9NUV1_9ACTN|nr:serine hydrolase domain-containing protein [Nocardioides massiliensis]MDP9824213.1 CubicO group peptidase (beta-lactamase class C family) [Nocardioides massiliensis]
MERHELETTVRDRLGDGLWGAGLVTPEATHLVRNGLPEDGDVEIGSISKGVTGLLYVTALDRDEVTADDRLAQHLPDLGGSPAGDVPLGSLARHRSGLPRLPKIDGMGRRSWDMLVHAANPYGDSLADLLAQTRRTKVGRPGRPAYSNLGFQLLGHALAAAAGTTYADLVRQRVSDPLGLGSWHVPATTDDLRPTAVHGTTRRGRAAAAWTGEGIGPAGGIRSTLADLTGFAEALLAGTAPGIAALDPVADFLGRGVRIGAAWITTEADGRAITWHNGGTGGWRTYLGLDRAAGRAVVVVQGRAASVDALGVELVRGS